MFRPHPITNLILPSGGVLYQEREGLQAVRDSDPIEPPTPAYSSVITLNRNQRRRKFIKAEKAARKAKAAARALANATPASSQN